MTQQELTELNLGQSLYENAGRFSVEYQIRRYKVCGDKSIDFWI